MVRRVLLGAAAMAMVFAAPVFEPVEPVERCVMDRQTGEIICEPIRGIG